MNEALHADLSLVKALTVGVGSGTSDPDGRRLDTPPTVCRRGVTFMLISSGVGSARGFECASPTPYRSARRLPFGRAAGECRAPESGGSSGVGAGTP